ncbi:MAG: MMPL family transporter [Pirellulaceae bacterium]|nr:MMPL family transporter [Pirellulaceae bacterium]
MNHASKPDKNWPPPWLPWAAVFAVLLAWPFVGYGAIRALQSSKNRIEDWLPASFEETKSLYAFFDRFGSDEFLMISWKGCVLGDPRIEKLQSLLVAPDESGVAYFAKADGGTQVLRTLIDQQKMSEVDARKRLTRLFIGPDQNQTCVIALISNSGFEDRKSAIQTAWQATQQATGLPIDDIHIAGTTADSVAVDAASNQWLMELNALSSLVCFIILVVSLRKIWLIGVLFLSAILNQQLALAFIYYSGGHVDSVQLLVANLSFVLTISAGLHYLGYFRDATRQGAKSPALEALKQSAVPSILASVTTSLGFLSLCTSVIVPIKSFGFYAAIIVPINTIIVVASLTIHAQWSSNRNWRLKPIHEVPTAATSHRGLQPAPRIGFWESLILPIIGPRPLVVVLGALAILITVGLGITKLRTSVGTHKMLAPDAKLLRDYAWLEENIGPLVPIELVLHFPHNPSSDGADSFQRLVAIERLRSALSGIPEIESTMSVLNFLPPLPQGGGIRNTARRSVIGKLAAESHEQFRSMRVYFADDEQEYWRLSGRVGGAVTTNYEQVLDKVQTVIAEFQAIPEYREVKVDVSGGVPFVYRTQRQLLLDLLSSFTTAFISIAASMALLFRSISGGLLTMLPNVSPAAIVFGTMGWCGLEVEIGTVLTASVMMGVCVDDTLHLVSHFRLLRRSGLEHRAAVSEALSNCGGAMVQTALVCGMGMLVFAFSPFTPVARFAWLTFALLMVGVVSDIVLTPAMLLSPLHHLFYWERRRATEKVPAMEAVS